MFPDGFEGSWLTHRLRTTSLKSNRFLTFTEKRGCLVFPMRHPCLPICLWYTATPPLPMYTCALTQLDKLFLWNESTLLTLPCSSVGGTLLFSIPGSVSGCCHCLSSWKIELYISSSLAAHPIHTHPPAWLFICPRKTSVFLRHF